MVPSLKEKALEFQAREERQQELDHFSNRDIMKTVDDIISFIRGRKSRTPYTKLQKKFPHFCDKYPALSARILANPNSFKPGGRLRIEFEDILSKRQSLIDGKSDKNKRNQVEGEIYNTYIAPHLPK